MTNEGEPKDKDGPSRPLSGRAVPVTGTHEDDKMLHAQQDDNGWHKRDPVGDSADDGHNPNDADRVTGERDPAGDSADDSPEG